jgi:hypothetical protein
MWQIWLAYEVIGKIRINLFMKFYTLNRYSLPGVFHMWKLVFRRNEAGGSTARP